ncbi:MAG: response regulator transcription factor [Leptolyngbya sp. IPPAS B-1204]|nr:response regulator transcription factor [Elainella sp. C42_A2020_010]RNJ71137.1 MAG: DNA-binding response regulator [Leptolyngbya sp. IPPAS B-1204]
MIRVFIVADSAIVQAGLAAIVRTERVEVVGCAAQVNELQIEQLAVEVVLISTELSAETLDATLPLLDVEPPIPAILWLVDPLQAAWIAEAERLGIAGLLPQDASAREIVAAIEAAAVGLVVLHPEIASQLRHPTPTVALTPSLTQREIEILRMLAEGMANKTIARQLYISEHTVKFHISSIFAKLGVSSRTEAVTIGIRQGLILL